MSGVLTKRVPINLKEDGGEQEQIEEALKAAISEIERGHGVVVSVVPTSYYKMRQHETFMSEAIIVYRQEGYVHECAPPPRSTQ